MTEEEAKDMILNCEPSPVIADLGYGQKVKVRLVKFQVALATVMTANGQKLEIPLNLLEKEAA
jgi:hypothetical protein